MNRRHAALVFLVGCQAAGPPPAPVSPTPFITAPASPDPPPKIAAPETETVSELTNATRPQFSADARHVALVVEREEAHLLLLDGREVVRSRRHVTHFAIARDGSSVTYALEHVEDSQRHVLVHRGVTTELAGEPVGVVVDASRVMLATSTKNGDDGAVFVDGVKVATAIGARLLTLGPDRRRWAFAATVSNRTGGETVTVDGVKTPVRGAALDLVFSNDARHVAYQAALAEGTSVVLDGKPSRIFRRTAGPPGFTSDGRLFHGGVTSAGAFVVVGTVDHGPYTAVGPIAGQELHVAWAAETLQGQRLVTEVFLNAGSVWRTEHTPAGPLEDRAPAVQHLVVSATGRAAFQAGTDVVVVRPSGLPVVIGTGAPLAFDPSGRLLAVFTPERRVRVVDIETNRTLFVTDSVFDGIFAESLRFEADAIRWYGAREKSLVRARKPLLTR